jgi:hypothetical protein
MGELTKEVMASFLDISQSHGFRKDSFGGKIRPISLNNKYIVLQHRPRTVVRLVPFCLYPCVTPRQPHTRQKIVEEWQDDTTTSCYYYHYHYHYYYYYYCYNGMSGHTCAVIGLTFGTGSSPTLGNSDSMCCENIGGTPLSIAVTCEEDMELVESSSREGRCSMLFLRSYDSGGSLSQESRSLQ